MSSLTNVAENALGLLLFNNTDWALIGDAGGLRGSATAGSLYLSLHTADPAETGNQSSSEIAYTNYARIAVVRSGAGFTVSADTVTNAALAAFPQCGVTGGTATHCGVGASSSGSGVLIARAPSPLVINENITPTFQIGALSFVWA